MIDFVKVQIINTTDIWIQNLERNSLLEFKTVVSTRSGELSDKKEAEYKGMKFIIYESGFILLQGSLHKYWNVGKHNYNSFTYYDLVEVIEDLRIKFDLSLNNCVLNNLEVGVNIRPPVPTNQILNNLMFHRNIKFKDKDVRMFKGNYKQVRHGRYYIKAYNKKLQYENDFILLDDILRFELKYVRMEDLKKFNIRTLIDLVDKTKLAYLKSNLIKVWAEILFFDKSIKRKNLKKNQREIKIREWANPNYWGGLNKQRRNEQKKIYNSIVEYHSLQIQKQVYNLISEEFDFLLNPLPINHNFFSVLTLPFNSSIIGLNSNSILPVINEIYF